MTPLAAYLQRRDANEAFNQESQAGELRQAGALQQLMANAEKQRREQAVRESIAQSGGDVEAAMAAALKAGDVAAAHQLAPLVKLKQDQAQQQMLSGADMNDPATLRRLGTVLKRPEFITHAERIESQQRDASTLDAMRQKPAITPDPQEVAQSQDQGTPAPQTKPAQAGLFASLLTSKAPGVADHAKNLQAQMEQYPNVAPAYWEKARDALTARDVAHQGKAAEPLVAVVDKDGKPKMLPRSKAEGMTPYSPSIAGAGQFTPEALRMTAEQYLAGDRQAVAGYARNASARIALQNEIVKLAKEKGWKGADVAAQMADFQGIMSGSRTVGTRAAQIELASSEAEKMIDIVIEKSKGFDRTSFVPLNKALRAFETQTGQPEVKAFGAAINSLVNVYARAISPSGVPTVSDKEHAREMLAQADSPEQVAAVMDVMRQEMKAARSAPVDVRAATRRAVTGAGEPAPAAPAATAPSNLTPAEQAELATLRKKHGR